MGSRLGALRRAFETGLQTGWPGGLPIHHTQGGEESEAITRLLIFKKVPLHLQSGNRKVTAFTTGIRYNLEASARILESCCTNPQRFHDCIAYRKGQNSRKMASVSLSPSKSHRKPFNA